MTNLFSQFLNYFSKSTNNYPNMYKEILEQSDIVNKLLSEYVDESGIVKINVPSNLYKFVFIASGSSYHAATIAANYFRTSLNCNAQSFYSSEFYLNNCGEIRNDTLYVFISQSGETADTNKAFDIVSSKTLNTLSITNSEQSRLYEKTTHKILVHAGVEKSIASTKALFAQIFCLFLLALKVLQNEQIPSISILDELKSVKNIFTYVYAEIDKIKYFAKTLIKNKNVAILGSGMFYPLAKEGALKIKETSYINSNAYPIGEFLHGHIAILNKKSSVISLLNNRNSQFCIDILKKINLDYKVNSLIISALPIGQPDNKNIILLNTVKDIEFLFGSLLVLQLLAFYTASYLNKNVDSPNGLTKIVQ